MRPLHLSLLPLLLAASLARAELRPSFQLEPCAWHATHVVVVTEGEEIDGELLVLESWKGDLDEGAELTIAPLAELAPEAARTIGRNWFQRDDPEAPKLVTNARMVLFLVRDGASWKPADTFARMMPTSMIWIEGGDAYALDEMQRVPLEISELALRTKVAEVITAQHTFDDARQNGAQALEAVMPELFGKASFPMQWLLLAELKTCGPEAVPALRGILRDPAQLHHHAQAVTAMATAGGRAVEGDLLALLAEETVFWRECNRTQLALWQAKAELPNEVSNLFGSHYGRVYVTLASLRKLRAENAGEAVAAFREVWRSIAKTERDQLIEECGWIIGSDRAH